MLTTLRLVGSGLILIGLGGFEARAFASVDSFVLSPWITPILLLLLVVGMCILLRYSIRLPLVFRTMNDKLDKIEDLVEKK